MTKKKLWPLLFVLWTLLGGCELQIMEPSPDGLTQGTDQLPTSTSGTLTTCDIFGPTNLYSGTAARYLMNTDVVGATFLWTVVEGAATFSCNSCKSTIITIPSNVTQVRINCRVQSPSITCDDAFEITRGGSGCAPGDVDCDGIPDSDDSDDDNDGIPDSIDPDDDNDGVPDKTDDDEDNDGIDDDQDDDDDNDDLPDDYDDDDDNDGTPDVDEGDDTGEPTPLCSCPSPKVTIYDPYPSDPNRNCNATSTKMYSFTVAGTQPGDILQWTGSTNAKVQNGQGTTSVAVYIGNSSANFSVSCKVTRKCNGTTFIRTGTYSSNISQQCKYFGQSTTGDCGIFPDPD